MDIQIELTNHCMLKCEECPNRDMKRKRQYMTTDVFNAIISRFIIGENPDTITISKDGEPLLHPQIRHFITEIVKTTDCKIDIYTNGLLLTEDFCKFLGTLRNRFRILLTYHKYNYNGKENNYDSVFSELRKCIELNLPNIWFVLATHVTDLSKESDLYLWKKHWDTVKKAYPNLKDVHVNKNINPWAKRIKQKHMSSFQNCSYGNFWCLFVGVTGNIIPCCVDLEEEIILGSVMEDSIRTIHDRVGVFYEKINNGIIEHDLCWRCLDKKKERGVHNGRKQDKNHSR